jgi:hypothetical protein
LISLTDYFTEQLLTQIAQIVALLDDPEGAYFGLEKLMNRLQAGADRSAKEAKQLQQKFTSLLEFIMDLSKASDDARGML